MSKLTLITSEERNKLRSSEAFKSAENVFSPSSSLPEGAVIYNDNTYITVPQSYIDSVLNDLK